MAVRKRLLHDDATRQKIQTSQLINRLQGNALGQVELSPTQQKSIEILLRKSLPDLSAIQLSGDEDNPVNMAIVNPRDAARAVCDLLREAATEEEQPK